MSELSSNQFALLSTLDGRLGFNDHCVILFGTEKAAVKYAADLIRSHEPRFEKFHGHWKGIYGEEYGNQRLVDAFGDILGAGEWFKVVPVEQAVGAQASGSC